MRPICIKTGLTLSVDWISVTRSARKLHTFHPALNASNISTCLHHQKKSVQVRYLNMGDEVSSVEAEIEAQGKLVRELKTQKAEKSKIDEEVSKLLALKAKLKESSPSKSSTANGQDADNGPRKLVLKTAKGMQDYGQDQMEVRERAFEKIIACFKRHGAQAIDTPVVELREILTGKYGEESKLIYDLQDQGGELLSMRYDLTVPFARYVAQNKIMNIKRYQIGKVYRRDNPVMTKGRYREFYQCDFDIAGPSDPMIADTEIIKLVHEILSDLGINSFQIKINHREILDGMFAVCGVPKKLFKSICSSIDKLDKTPWDDVRKEMVDEKRLDEKIADKIGELVKLNGSSDLIEQLISGSELNKNVMCKRGLEQLKILFDFCDVLGIKDCLKFDLSLARGLDYYTGLIYEAVLTDGADGVGSIAAGGRYDGLVGLFSENKHSTPCVGVSIGIERIFSILEQRQSLEPKNLYPTKCYVVSIGKNMVTERFKLLSILWNNNINAEHSTAKNPKLLDQLQFCEKKGIPVVAIIGEDEINKSVVKLRVVKNRNEVTIPRDDFVQELRNILDSDDSSS